MDWIRGDRQYGEIFAENLKGGSVEDGASVDSSVMIDAL